MVHVLDRHLYIYVASLVDCTFSTLKPLLVTILYCVCAFRSRYPYLLPNGLFKFKFPETLPEGRGGGGAWTASRTGLTILYDP